MSDHLDRNLAKQVIFLIRQGLTRRHDDTLARVDAHRIEIFHIADGDAVVVVVANDFIFDFFPAGQIFLN